MKAHQWSRRTFYLAAAVAIVASTSGFALASVLAPPTTVSQGANFYDSSNGGVPGYQTPTLAVAASPGACSGGTVVDGTSGGAVSMVVSAWSHAGNCTAGDFAEMFTIDYTSPSTTTHVDNFTIYSQIGAGPMQTNFVHLQLGTGVAGPFTATISLYVDYGAAPPLAGISQLELVIHHP